MRKLENKFDIYLCFGFAFLIVMQALIHIMVNLYLIPNTGQSLPLISVGGTSTLFVCFALGVLNNFNMKTYKDKNLKSNKTADELDEDEKQNDTDDDQNRYSDNDTEDGIRGKEDEENPIEIIQNLE